MEGLGVDVPLKYIEHGAYGDLIIMYPKPYSIHFRGTTMVQNPIMYVCSGLPRSLGV